MKKYCHGSANCEHYNSWPDYTYNLIEEKCQFCDDYRELNSEFTKKDEDENA